MTIYADSSFLVSVFINDPHSEEADRRMNLIPSVWITPLNRAELSHAFHQCVFRAKITFGEAQDAWNDFEEDCASGILEPVNLPERTWGTSIDLSRQYGPTLGVRTLDSLHIASALELKAECFWTFDERQMRLAEAVGLKTSL